LGPPTSHCLPLGNFSFGDYFKEQAIAWAWKLATEVFKLPPEHLVPSVYEEDDDAFAIWRDQIGIPAHRIQRMGQADNFWESGPDELESPVTLVALLQEGQVVSQAQAGDSVQLILDRTPFYAESGGQIGDRGYLLGDDLVIAIEDVQKESTTFVHYGRI
jgi:alanyl-tRNA synthetase